MECENLFLKYVVAHLSISLMLMLMNVWDEKMFYFVISNTIHMQINGIHIYSSELFKCEDFCDAIELQCLCLLKYPRNLLEVTLTNELRTRHVSWPFGEGAFLITSHTSKRQLNPKQGHVIIKVIILMYKTYDYLFAYCKIIKVNYYWESYTCIH